MFTHKNRWWVRGLNWGLGMFILMEILWPFIHGEKPIAMRLLFGIFLWGIGGLGFGWILNLIGGNKKTYIKKS